MSRYEDYKKVMSEIKKMFDLKLPGELNKDEIPFTSCATVTNSFISRTPHGVVKYTKTEPLVG